MKINIDSFFQIGHAHSICQDYTFHRVLDFPELNVKISYAILADGCSSSPNTDIGARLLVHKTDKIIKDIFTYDPYFMSIDEKDNISNKIKDALLQENPSNIKNLVYSLGLNNTCLDCTLWIIINSSSSDESTRDSVTEVIGYGDGQVIYKKNNKIEIDSIGYESGAPFYFNYLLNPVRGQLYEKQFNKTCHKYIITKDKEDILDVKFNQPYLSRIEGNDFTSITICSDGFNTYNNKTIYEASERLVDFKSLEGVFLERRMKALDRKDKHDNINHYDDISACSLILIKD